MLDFLAYGGADQALVTRADGVPWVDDRRVLSGIIHVHKRGLQWWDASAEYDPHKTFFNRIK